METRTLGFHAHPPPQSWGGQEGGWVSWGGPIPGLTVLGLALWSTVLPGRQRETPGPSLWPRSEAGGRSEPPRDPPAHLPQLGAGKRDSGTLGLPETGGKHGNKAPGVGRWDLGRDLSALEKEIPSGFLTSLLSLMHMPGPTCSEQGTLGAPPDPTRLPPAPQS